MLSANESQSSILIVDDDKGLLLSIQGILLRSGLPEPALASDSSLVMDKVRKNHYNLVLLDLIMPPPDGIELLKQIKESFPDIECIIVTAVDDVPTAVKAIKYDAYDYLVKPLDPERLVISVKRALERQYLRRSMHLQAATPVFSDLKHPEAFNNFIAKDKGMAKVFHQAEMVGPSEYSVIIAGDSGTGKELLAQAIHKLSLRSNGPYHAINMAAINPNLAEDELFGHSKGAFTGADSERLGIFESTTGGTIFLDEITEMNPDLQSKLLRVVQEREVSRLGSTTVRKVDVRIIASTNRDINEEVRQGRFRSDLFYRLNNCHIRIPPLKDRKQDIIPLAHYFLKKHSSNNNKDIKSLSSDLIERLLSYSFPGNVRELENIISSGVIFEQSHTLTLETCFGSIGADSLAQKDNIAYSSLSDIEKDHILKVVEAAGGNTAAASNILGLSLRTLQRKLKSFKT